MDNTNLPPPTHFYYINPQQPIDGSRVHINQHRTYVVNSAEKASQPHIIVQQPIPMVQPTIVVSQPVVRQQTQMTPVMDRSLNRSHSATRLSGDLVPRAEYERCQNECRMW